MHALPLAAGINKGGHYFRYIIPLVVCFVVVTTAIQNHRRGCHRVSNFCLGPLKKRRGRFLGFFLGFLENIRRRSALKLHRGFILTKKGDINPNKNSEPHLPGGGGAVFILFSKISKVVLFFLLLISCS